MIRVTIEIDGYPRTIRIEEQDEFHSTRGQTIDKLKESARRATNAAVQAVSAE